MSRKPMKQEWNPLPLGRGGVNIPGECRKTPKQAAMLLSRGSWQDAIDRLNEALTVAQQCKLDAERAAGKRGWPKQEWNPLPLGRGGVN